MPKTNERGPVTKIILDSREERILDEAGRLASFIARNAPKDSPLMHLANKFCIEHAALLGEVERQFDPKYGVDAVASDKAASKPASEPAPAAEKQASEKPAADPRPFRRPAVIRPLKNHSAPGQSAADPSGHGSPAAAASPDRQAGRV